MTNRFSAPNWLDQVEKDVDESGYSIVEGVLSKAVLDDTRARMYDVQKKILREIGPDRLRAANELGVLRLMMRYDQRFIDFLEIPAVVQVVDRLLAPTAIMHLQNGFILPSHPQGETPRVFQNQFHMDFPRYLNGYRASINVFFAIDEFTKETGATWVVPGYFQRKDRPEEKFMRENSVASECVAGSMIIFESTLWHAAGDNVSGKDRLAINHQFTRAFLKQQMDYVRSLEESEILRRSLRTQQMLGYFTRLPSTLEEYYQPEEKRFYRKNQG